jgi:ABC-type transport system substrate-binding protein
MAAPISRRIFLRNAIVGAGALAGLNAGAAGIFSVHASEKVKRGGIWRAAQAHTPPTLDAQRISMYWASIGAMYDCLLSIKTNPKTYGQEIVPGLASEWQVEKKGRRVIFVLRKGVRFHDGSRFDAQVAKWNLDRVRTHPKSYLKADDDRRPGQLVQFQEPQGGPDAGRTPADPGARQTARAHEGNPEDRLRDRRAHLRLRRDPSRGDPQEGQGDPDVLEAYCGR